MVSFEGRLEGRNGEIWRKHLLGWTQEALAQEHGLTQARISQILADVRATIPPVDLVQARQTHQELLADLRRRVSEIALAPLPPVTAGKDGRPVVDPVTGEYVRDASGRYQALMGVAKLEERMAKLMGLDAAEKVDVSVTDASRRAAEAAAAEALARLHGGTGE